MTEPLHRPDPDQLLEKLRTDAAKERRAKLKIFFGFAPGVGKTYRMLQVARELVDQKLDLVVGPVETHGRYDIGALTLGLELLSDRALDLDLALKRKPRVLVLD